MSTKWVGIDKNGGCYLNGPDRLGPKRKRKKAKKKRCAGKGSAYERELCKLLGRWWSGGDRDDIFWRTSNSGGRATVRGRQSTFGQAGDIQATDPIGQPLMDVISFELKRGYPSVSPLDLFEEKQPKDGLASWIEQAKTDAAKSNALHWAVVWKRNRRKSLMFFPRELGRKLVNVAIGPVTNRFVFQARLLSPPAPSLFIMSVDDFLAWCTPEMILSIHQEFCGDS